MRDDLRTRLRRRWCRFRGHPPLIEPIADVSISEDDRGIRIAGSLRAALIEDNLSGGWAAIVNRPWSCAEHDSA